MEQETKKNTIARYCELKQQAATKSFKGTFYAFNNEQFEEGYKKILPLRTGDEKVVHFGYGLYGWRKYLDEMVQILENVNKVIKEECNPQDVYNYEYNNYECEISYTGDKEAIELVVEIYGYDIARTIERKNIYMTIDQMELNKTTIKVKDLHFGENNETPNDVWFDNEGLCYTMYNSCLYPVKDKNGKQYRTKKKLLYDLCAKYNGIKLYDFYRE